MFSTVSRRELLKHENDENLLINYQADKNPSFANELYARYIHLIYGAALKYLDDKSQSKELALQVFGKILLVKNPQNIKSLNHLIYTMVKNECFSILRKENTKQGKEYDWALTENPEEVYVENEALTSELLEEENNYKKQLRDSIQQLPDQQKICVELFFLKGKKYKEIILQTGYGEKQVKSFIQNGKRNLKKLLENAISE